MPAAALQPFLSKGSQLLSHDAPTEFTGKFTRSLNLWSKKTKLRVFTNTCRDRVLFWSLGMFRYYVEDIIAPSKKSIDLYREIGTLRLLLLSPQEALRRIFVQPTLHGTSSK